MYYLTHKYVYTKIDTKKMNFCVTLIYLKFSLQNNIGVQTKALKFKNWDLGMNTVTSLHIIFLLTEIKSPKYFWIFIVDEEQEFPDFTKSL